MTKTTKDFMLSLGYSTYEVGHEIVGYQKGDDGASYLDIDQARLMHRIFIEGQIEALSGVQLEHGRYLTQTFVNGQAMAIEERIAILTHGLEELDKEKI